MIRRHGWRGEVEGTWEPEDGPSVLWTAEVECFYRPGRFSGPPENCYPDESECEILSVLTDPPGFENQIPEELIEDAAWLAFDDRQAAMMRGEE